jgi:hypothetical protein
MKLSGATNVSAVLLALNFSSTADGDGYVGLDSCPTLRSYERSMFSPFSSSIHCLTALSKNSMDQALCRNQPIVLNSTYLSHLQSYIMQIQSDRQNIVSWRMNQNVYFALPNWQLTNPPSSGDYQLYYTTGNVHF